MKIKLTSSQKQQIKKIGQKYGLVFAVVFGSTVKGQRGQESDFDIAVLTKKKPSYSLFKNLFSEFSEVFKGENIDVRFLNEADPFFRFQVVKDGQLLYGSRDQYLEYLAYAYKSYIDDAQSLLETQKKVIYKNQERIKKSQLLKHIRYCHFLLDYLKKSKFYSKAGDCQVNWMRKFFINQLKTASPNTPATAATFWSILKSKLNSNSEISCPVSFSATGGFAPLRHPDPPRSPKIGTFSSQRIGGPKDSASRLRNRNFDKSGNFRLE